MTETSEAKVAVTPMADLLADYLPELHVLREEPKPASEPKQPTEEETRELPEGSPDGTEAAETSSEAEETEAGTEEETGEEETETQEEQDQHRNAWPDSARKRVDKLTAKLREAEQRETAKAGEVEELREKLAQATQQAEAAAKQAQPATSAASGPLANAWSESDLVTEANKALNWKQWALSNPDGGVVKVGDREQEYTAEQVERIKLNSDRILNLEIPRRKQFLAEATMLEKQVAGVFPEYFDPKSEDHQAAMGALKEFPELRSRPDGMVVAIALGIGLRQMATLRKQREESKKTGAKAPATSTKPAAARVAPRPTEPAAMPGSVAGNTAPKRNREKAVESVVARGGDVDALTEFFS